MDVVPNHTSSAHPWFQAALAAGPGTDARERYFFRDGRGPDGALPPNNWTSVFGGSAWTRVVEPDGNPGQWYLHLFDAEQPDLNWEHPDVFDDFEKTLRFWLERGVDGFRIDVARIGDVIAMVGHRRNGDRVEPDRVDPELRQVIQAGGQPVQIADAVAVAVGE